MPHLVGLHRKKIMNSSMIHKAVQNYLNSGKKIKVFPSAPMFSITEEMIECAALNARMDIPVFNVCLTTKQQGKAILREWRDE
jgi:hypothetical protein